MEEFVLDDVGWCERCLRPFDRPKPTSPQRGWRVCDECKSKKNRARGRLRKARMRAASNLEKGKA